MTAGEPGFAGSPEAELLSQGSSGRQNGRDATRRQVLDPMIRVDRPQPLQLMACYGNPMRRKE
jgi:hypothetical protein